MRPMEEGVSDEPATERWSAEQWAEWRAYNCPRDEEGYRYDPYVRLRRNIKALENEDARKPSQDARIARWVALGIPYPIAELQARYERHIEIHRMRNVARMTFAEIGTKLFLSGARVGQIYFSKSHEKTPPISKWLRDGEAYDLAQLAMMPARTETIICSWCGRPQVDSVLSLDDGTPGCPECLEMCWGPFKEGSCSKP